LSTVDMTALGVKLYAWLRWLKALLGCGFGTLWDMFFVRDPKTGMTQWELIHYLEETQDPHERELQAKADLAAEKRHRDLMMRKTRAEQTEKRIQEEGERQREEYEKLTDQEKQVAMTQQTQREQDLEAKQNRAAAITARTRKKKAAPSVEKPADRSASQRYTASTARSSPSPIVSAAKPRATPSDYPSREQELQAKTERAAGITRSTRYVSTEKPADYAVR